MLVLCDYVMLASDSEVLQSSSANALGHFASAIDNHSFCASAGSGTTHFLPVPSL
jgi:hypothetical protein